MSRPFLALLLIHTILHYARGAPATEIPSLSQPVTTYSISQLTPKFFVKTDEFELNSTSCMQYSFTLSAEKVKLRAYECLMGEDGFCIMNKHLYKKNSEENNGCRTLRPWYRHFKNYAFYFTLEKRERKYGPGKEHLKRKRARKVRQNGRIEAKTIGVLKLEGVKPCSEACL